MIKVGDTVMFKNEEYSVINIHTPIFRSRNEVAHLLLENRNNTVVLPLTAYYKQLHEQQKQRADELENDKKQLGGMCTIERERGDKLQKRWNELKDFINESAMLADEKFQKVNNAALLSEAITCKRIVYKMNELEEQE